MEKFVYHLLYSCTDFELPESGLKEPNNSKDVALQRVLKHKDAIMKVNPMNDKDKLDEALRMALTYLMTDEKEIEANPDGCEIGLRYIRDRINVPRDMPIWSARRLRAALEFVASKSATDKKSPPIPTSHRKDQEPKYFKNG